MRKDKRKAKVRNNSMIDPKTVDVGHISFSDFLPNSIVKAPSMNHSSHSMNSHRMRVKSQMMRQKVGAIQDNRVF